MKRGFVIKLWNQKKCQKSGEEGGESQPKRPKITVKRIGYGFCTQGPSRYFGHYFSSQGPNGSIPTTKLRY